MGYKIELLQSNAAGAKDFMYRAGIKFDVGQPQTLELTEEELEVFKNDWRFKISDSKDTGATDKKAKAAASKTVSSAGKPFAKPIADFEAEAVTDTSAPQKETVDGTVQELSFLDSLLKDFSREELNKQAKKLGIKKPETFDNKTEVAKAIVDAR